MGKWLSRVIEKDVSRDDNSADIPENRTDRTDRIPASIIPATVLPSIDHLTETERLAFEEMFEHIQGQGLSLEEAKCIAWQVIDRNQRVLQFQQAIKDYRSQGWIKIHCTVLGECLYLVRDKEAAKQVPDSAMPFFTEAEIESCKGLDLKETKLLLEARLIFGGEIT